MSSDTGPARNGARPRQLLWDAAVVALVVLAYAPALRGGFVFDDHVLLEGNGLLHGPLWRIWFSADPVDWWPLTYTSFWIENRLWGEAPAGYHLVNVVLHAGTAVLLARTLSAWRIPGARLAAVLFAVHPVAVESVAWVSERKNTLSAVFFWGALLVWARFQDSRRRRDGALALGLFVLALLSKTSTVMLPFVLLLGAWWRRDAIRRRDLLDAAPFFGIALVFGLVTTWFQWTHAMQGFVSPRGPAERIGGAAWALLSYLQKALFPWGVAFVYPQWPLAPSSAWFYLPLVAVALSVVVLWFARGRLRPVTAALAYHAILVLPVLGLLEIAYFHFGPVANHLQYLALAGPVALVAAGADRLGRLWNPRIVRAAALATIGLLASVTWTRAAAFEDDFTLWQRAAREAPGSVIGAWMYADQLAERERPRDALAELARVSEEARGEASREAARALYHLHAGRHDDAVAALGRAQAIRSDPDLAFEMGGMLTRAGRPDLAVPLLESLVLRAPRSLDYRYALALALSRAGQEVRATEVLRPACTDNLNSASTCDALATLLVRLGRADEAGAITASRRRRNPGDGREGAELRRR